MDQYEPLDREIRKMDVRKLLSVFYEEAYEEYFPLLKAESDKQEYPMVTKEMLEKIPEPENIEFPEEFVDNVEESMKDAVYVLIRDVVRDFMHGRREGKYLGWKNTESPAMLFAMAGAQIVDPEAKFRLNGIIHEMGVEIARYAYEYANHAGRTVVDPSDIEIAARRLKNKVNITQEDLRDIIRDELAKSKQ